MESWLGGCLVGLVVTVATTNAIVMISIALKAKESPGRLTLPSFIKAKKKHRPRALSEEQEWVKEQKEPVERI